MYTAQESMEIQSLRRKVEDGSITPQELRRGIELLAKSRGQAATVSAASKAKKAAKGPVDTQSLLGELDGL